MHQYEDDTFIFSSSPPNKNLIQEVYVSLKNYSLTSFVGNGG